MQIGVAIWKIWFGNDNGCVVNKTANVIAPFKDNIRGDDWASSFMKIWYVTNRTASKIWRKWAKVMKEN